jgi:hypothetical protein
VCQAFYFRQLHSSVQLKPQVGASSWLQLLFIHRPLCLPSRTVLITAAECYEPAHDVFAADDDIVSSIVVVPAGQRAAMPDCNAHVLHWVMSLLLFNPLQGVSEPAHDVFVEDDDIVSSIVALPTGCCLLL